MLLDTGVVYYSDGRGDPRVLEAVRMQIVRGIPGWPLVSVTLGPVAFGRNIVLPLVRGQRTMFCQILTGLEALDTRWVFFCEHDCLYPVEHFHFRPSSRDRYYYNQATWKVCTVTGRALHYRCCQTSGLCADRELLVDHYRRRLAAVEASGGYQRHYGFEPGTNRWSRQLDGVDHATWASSVPIVDLRTGYNLTRSRWRRDQFRNQSTCQGWTEADAVPGWPGRTLGRFDAWLDDVMRRSEDDAVSH